MVKLIERYNGQLSFMILYWFICLVMFLRTFSFLYIMLAWNVFLAMLPLLFAVKVRYAIERGIFGQTVFWAIFWLLFFPNSVYMITDFIHISNDKLLRIIEADRYSQVGDVMYSTDIAAWAKLLVIGIGFLFAILVGLESLYLIEQGIKNKVSKLFSRLGILMVALLSGVGVYIGRFLRFNSWDVFLKPFHLLDQLCTGMDGFAVQFIAVFAVFIIVCYSLYRAFRSKPTAETI